jgi:hypothetical protein
MKKYDGRKYSEFTTCISSLENKEAAWKCSLLIIKS